MAKKIKKYKVGTDSETYAISLVESPAIEETLVALEEQKEIKVELANEEKHMVYSAVLVPDKDIYRNDGENEFYVNFTKDSIEKMSQDFMKEYRQHEITVDHEDIANEICVVESWLKSDMYKDKSVALGLNENLPIGTWFCGMKVNNIEVWDRVKNGELQGFSVESLISLEEFSKAKNENNMNIETDEMFFDKIKNAFKEVLASVSLAKREEESNEATKEELDKFNEDTNVEIVLEEDPQPTVEPQQVEEPQPTVEPQQADPQPQAEEPKEDNKHLEELINNLRSEIESLKQMNSGLQDKIADMGKQPSAQPVNTNAKPSNGNSYSQWRDMMRNMI